jgi:hypothetical protein
VLASIAGSLVARDRVSSVAPWDDRSNVINAEAIGGAWKVEVDDREPTTLCCHLTPKDKTESSRFAFDALCMRSDSVGMGNILGPFSPREPQDVLADPPSTSRVLAHLPMSA